MLQRFASRPALLIGALLLAACGSAVPEEKRDYVGHWRAPEMALQIGAEGDVSYWRLKENGLTVEIEAPLKEFRGDDFVVGVGFLTTTFAVSQPPRYQNGHWQMVVDGVRLER